MNADQAQSALDIAKRHYSNDNYSSALRFCKKSISLQSTPEAVALLARIEKADSAAQAQSSGTSSATSPPPSASTTSSRPTPRASTSKPSTSTPPAEDKARDYTPAQAALVKRVKACRVTQYYEILAIEKGCSDSEVKKAYRKLALGLHPDKCGAPGAEEAFKMVSKAFQVLSDSNKRAIFDQTGSDPDSRGGGGGGGGASPFARGGFGGQRGGFGGEELSPEDLFSMFFGQGGGGAQFGGGSPFGGGTFQFFGPGGVHMSTGGRRPGHHQHQRQAGGQQAAPGSMWLQIAPLLVLFLFSLLTQLPSLFGTSTPADPDFAFESMPKYTVPRTTTNMHIPYFVNPSQFAQHPIYASFISENPHLGFTSSNEPGSAAYRHDLTKFIRLPPREEGEEGTAKPVNVKVPSNLAKFERTVERSYISRIQMICRQEIQNRDERLDRARGFLGFGADWEKVKEITQEKLPRCAELEKFGYRVQY
ncbi:hypothetical protein BCR35DRAFT_315995 [Leucosporidium creatinivorum]|uniref:J domain-containing protein n=1 Tax=Leucosporidium creatinivorum TaxID=106004 RepID=A0A1Y2D915_9BASI|nr:hypothetical protein BCR35DRAFT_315995 [Leucosporidium creatinivorum]